MFFIYAQQRIVKTERQRTVFFNYTQQSVLGKIQSIHSSVYFSETECVFTQTMSFICAL